LVKKKQSFEKNKKKDIYKALHLCSMPKSILTEEEEKVVKVRD